jgi:hypothetical protein
VNRDGRRDIQFTPRSHRFKGTLSLAGSLTKTIVVSLWFILLTAFHAGAQPNLRFAKWFHIPGGSEVVVVAEGEFEPRSVGSYAVRLYGGAANKFSTDDFIVGVIRPRNGTIEAVRFASVDGDDSREIVVIMRAVGSGGYVSADAFRYSKGSLEWVASVANLDKRSDPVQALRDKIRIDTGTSSQSK